MHPAEFRLLGRRAPCAWFSFVAMLGAVRRICQAVDRELSQYTLMPPNLCLTRRARVAYPSQKPQTSAASTTTPPSQRCAAAVAEMAAMTPAAGGAPAAASPLTPGLAAPASAAPATAAGA